MDCKERGDRVNVTENVAGLVTPPRSGNTPLSVTIPLADTVRDPEEKTANWPKRKSLVAMTLTGSAIQSGAMEHESAIENHARVLDSFRKQRRYALSGKLIIAHNLIFDRTASSLRCRLSGATCLP